MLTVDFYSDGPELCTHQMLSDVFDGQLNYFIKEYRAANPNPTQTESRAVNAPAHLVLRQ